MALGRFYVVVPPNAKVSGPFKALIKAEDLPRGKTCRANTIFIISGCSFTLPKAMDWDENCSQLLPALTRDDDAEVYLGRGTNRTADPNKSWSRNR